MKFVMLVSSKQNPGKFGIEKLSEYGHLDIAGPGATLQASGTIMVLDGSSPQVRKMLEEYKSIWVCDGPIQFEHYVELTLDNMKEEGDA
jgi:hypothetical protein